MLDAGKNANSWALQRKQALEKAQKLKEERKFNLAKAGEMSVANEMGSTGLGRYNNAGTSNYDFPRGPTDDYLPRKPATMKYGMSMMDQAPSEEEVSAARSSLALLKSKMKNSNGFPSNSGGGSGGGYGSNARQKGYFEEETHEYMPNAPGNRRPEQDQNYNDMYSNPNSNYRKVFKPSEVASPTSGGYQPMGSQSRMSKPLQQVNNYGSRDEYSGNSYGGNSYGGGPQSKTNVSGKPSMGSGRFDPPQQNGYGKGGNDDYSDFSSKNVPSRIPKNTMGGKQQANAYEDDYAAPSKPNFAKGKNFESEAPSGKYGQQQQQQNDPYGGGGGYNPQQRAPAKNAAPPSKAGGYGGQAKGKPGNFYDEPQENDQSYKDFSKPSFKKAPTQSFDDIPIAPKKNAARAIPNDPQDQGPDDGPMIECRQGCGRSFFEHALEKHEKICVKVFQKKRKVFNSADQRAGDEEIETNTYSAPPKKGAAGKGGKPGAGPKGASSTGNKWKQQSEAFRANLRAARGGTLTKEEQTALAQASSAGMVQCDHCGRKFSETAAARHIPFCQTKNKIDTIKKGGKPGKR